LPDIGNAALKVLYMRYLIISDIHSNLTAFETVLKHAGKQGRDYDFVWCLGDVVGYGPDPNECCDLLRSLPNLCLAGNHDWAALGRLDIRTFNTDARKAASWTQQELRPDNREYLEALPITFVLGDYTLVHASPREPVWEYILDPLIAALNLPHFQTPFCLVGHTHTPVTYRQINDKGDVEPLMPEYDTPQQLNGARLIVNPGSVGQPRDSDPRAAYAILDVETNTWEFRRVEYSVAKVQKRMRRVDMPDRLVVRLEHGW
jgi:diadenosine tetraphosphatase ApaH/serine/threonine PP2A family protein phosphatase